MGSDTVSLCVLGGTFDPVHNAHLAIARRALEAVQAERLLWIPTGSPPYRKPPVASAAHRLAMLRLAIAGEPGWHIDERELAPGASGYTVDTLESLRAQHPGSPLVMLLGADQFAKLGSWHRPERLFELCRFAVFARPGWPVTDPRAAVIPMAPLEISASDIRARLARGDDVSALVPAPVLAYIRAHGLYR